MSQSHETNKGHETTKCPGLDAQPETVEALFNATCVSPVVKGKSGATYQFPWLGWTDPEKAPKGASVWASELMERIEHFEQHYPGVARWVPFNENEFNQGVMSINRDSAQAFNERVTNAWDAVLELAVQKAIVNGQSEPQSPHEAALLLGLPEDPKELKAAAARLCYTRNFASRNQNAWLNCLVVRDYGIGIHPDSFAATILSTNRGNKASKPYQIGKHGQGASNTFQFCRLSIVVSRRVATDVAGFTFVKQMWLSGSKTPTYAYLTVDGMIPRVTVTDEQFPHGTEVKHIQYKAHFPNAWNDNSLIGSLSRGLPDPVIPHVSYHYAMWDNAQRRAYTGMQSLRYSRGAVVESMLAHQDYLTGRQEGSHHQVPHYQEEVFLLGQHDFGDAGLQDAGSVIFRYWFYEPEKGKPWMDAIRHILSPTKTVLVTNDGQTHSEEGKRLIVTPIANGGAGLGLVGRTLFVQVDCNGLTKFAKYDLFTSVRDSLKEGVLKDAIFQELIRRLKSDQWLREKEVQMTVSDRKGDKQLDEVYADQVKRFLREHGIKLDSILAVSSEASGHKPVETEEEKEPRIPPAPIEAKEVPTFIRWVSRSEDRRVTMYPGQQRSWVFETDSPAGLWKPEAQHKGQIRVTTSDDSVVQYRGSGQMRGGRVRCQFTCPKKAKVGQEGAFTVQLKSPTGAILSSEIVVSVVEEPPKRQTPQKGGTERGEGPVRELHLQNPLIRPIPITRESDQWNNYDLQNEKFGFIVVNENERDHLYYNAELPMFVEERKRFMKRGLGERFETLYRLHLALHAILSFNNAVQWDLNQFEDKDRVNYYRITSAISESLVRAVTDQIEEELKNARSLSLSAS